MIAWWEVTSRVTPTGGCAPKPTMRPSSITLVRILPRSAVPKQHVLARPATAVRAEAPSLIKELVDRQQTAGDAWPPNLRIETFEDGKADWNGYTKGVRSSLKEFAKER